MVGMCAALNARVRDHDMMIMGCSCDSQDNLRYVVHKSRYIRVSLRHQTPCIMDRTSGCPVRACGGAEVATSNSQGAVAQAQVSVHVHVTLRLVVIQAITQHGGRRNCHHYRYRPSLCAKHSRPGRNGSGFGGTVQRLGDLVHQCTRPTNDWPRRQRRQHQQPRCRTQAVGKHACSHCRAC